MPDASVDSTHWMIGCTWLTCHWPNFGGRRRRRVRPDCQATNQGYRAYCNDLQEWLPSRRVSANVVFCDPFYNAADGLFLSYHHRRSTKRAARLWAECMIHSPAGGHVGFPLLFCFSTSGLVHTRSEGQRHRVVQWRNIPWIAPEQHVTHPPSTCGSSWLCGRQYCPRRNAAIYIRSPTGANDVTVDQTFIRTWTDVGQTDFSIRSLSEARIKVAPKAFSTRVRTLCASLALGVEDETVDPAVMYGHVRPRRRRRAGPRSRLPGHQTRSSILNDALPFVIANWRTW
jgi:hypothetical protein